jgi:hypothetical protein
VVRTLVRRSGLTLGVALVTACAFQEPDCTDNIEGADASLNATSGPYAPDCNPCNEVCACTPGAQGHNGAFYGCPQDVTACGADGLWTFDCEGTACDASPGRADATGDDAEAEASDSDAAEDGSPDVDVESDAADD